ncbi:MAG: hypothetical protein PVH88_25745 [Ignavibacteria bacterium]|jgi:hypothetical protein
MQEQITFIEHKNYLEVNLEGERDYTNLLAIWESVLNKSDSSKLYKILITTKMTGSLSLVQYYNIFDKIRDNRIILKYKIAGFFEYTSQDEIEKFDKLIAQNEGWKVRLFNDYNKAKEWLLK